MIYPCNVVIVLIISLFLSACGQKGALYVPEKKAATQPTQVTPNLEEPVYASQIH